MGETPFRLRLPATPDIPEFRHACSEYVLSLGGWDGQVANVAQGVTEAVTNSIKHGYPMGNPGRIEVKAELSGDWLAVSIHDNGCGPQGASRNGGLGMGVPLMEAVSEQFELRDTGKGALVRMRFDLRQDQN
jgi:anti-sigma regulatory factor (Ser/Thr protein kinase)